MRPFLSKLFFVLLLTFVAVNVLSFLCDFFFDSFPLLIFLDIIFLEEDFLPDLSYLARDLPLRAAVPDFFFIAAKFLAALARAILEI